MNVDEFIQTYTLSKADFIMFKWNRKHGKDLIDENLHTRREIIKYIESVNFQNVPGELLRDLLIAEAYYSKESWGIYRHYHRLAENLIRQTGATYLDDYLISAFLSFDTYCSTLVADLSGVEIDDYINEINVRKANATTNDQSMLKTYEKGIELFLSYKVNQNRENEFDREIIIPSQLKGFKKFLGFIKKAFSRKA
ncbi:hypothetical protein LOZ80_13000 [Paenibacillus sp. HWE-109]|uniref:hypothetical protein n=1 Tax=Paenibacillus sp. HWE-109 TaxID=1306526 RepID=UPI001EE11A79|nr:hypothetical protein [Paenibacillus sp. HWE-109]UKS29791.1 hypothetical protein LOZ80_13000 [Paenibacillus sp. HWE-109]